MKTLNQSLNRYEWKIVKNVIHLLWTVHLSVHVLKGLKKKVGFWITRNSELSSHHQINKSLELKSYQILFSTHAIPNTTVRCDRCLGYLLSAASACMADPVCRVTNVPPGWATIRVGVPSADLLTVMEPIWMDWLINLHQGKQHTVIFRKNKIIYIDMLIWFKIRVNFNSRRLPFLVLAHKLEAFSAVFIIIVVA